MNVHITSNVKAPLDKDNYRPFIRYIRSKVGEETRGSSDQAIKRFDSYNKRQKSSSPSFSDFLFVVNTINTTT